MPGRNYLARPTFLNNYPNWNGKRPTKKASAEVVLVEMLETVEEVLAIFCQTSPNGRIQLKSRFGLHYPPLRSGVFHYTLSNFKFKQKWLYILMYTVYTITIHSTSTVLKNSQYVLIIFSVQCVENCRLNLLFPLLFVCVQIYMEIYYIWIWIWFIWSFENDTYGKPQGPTYIYC